MRKQWANLVFSPSHGGKKMIKWMPAKLGDSRMGDCCDCPGNLGQSQGPESSPLMSKAEWSYHPLPVPGNSWMGH